MRIFLLLSCLLFIAITSSAQEVQQKIPAKTRILFLLDGSGSMLASWGETDRMTAAKTLLAELVDSLRNNTNLQLALRAYGHRYSRGAQNCKDTKLEVSFSPSNHQLIIQKLERIQPKGTTPIAYSLQQAANDFPETGGYRNIIIIITDGIESCDGDPCAVSLALQKRGIFLKPFIIGIGMDLKYKQQFDCIGEFYDAKDLTTFRKALDKAISTSLDKTTASVLLFDENNKPTETNVNITFANNFTRQPAFDFVHYLDRNGKPDSVEIDPVLTYDIVANTLPPVVKQNVRFTPGKHNVVNLNTPQGTLNITQDGSSSYKNGVQAIIKKGRQTVHYQAINSQQRYITGSYTVEVLTRPARIFTNVSIEPKRTMSLSLPAPGILNLYTNAQGYGSIYEIKQDGTQQWVYNLAHDQSRQSIALQPGEYKVVFRVDQAPGSKYTTVKTIKIETGKSTTTRVFD